MASIYQHLAGAVEPVLKTHVFGALLRLWFMGDITNGQARALLEQALLHELVHRRALGCVHERPLEQDQAALGEDLERIQHRR